MGVRRESAPAKGVPAKERHKGSWHQEGGHREREVGAEKNGGTNKTPNARKAHGRSKPRDPSKAHGQDARRERDGRSCKEVSRARWAWTT